MQLYKTLVQPHLKHVVLIEKLCRGCRRIHQVVAWIGESQLKEEVEQICIFSLGYQVTKGQIEGYTIMRFIIMVDSQSYFFTREKMSNHGMHSFKV